VSDVDAGSGNLSQRALDALVRDESPHVALLAAGVLEEREIRASGVPVDQPINQPQKTLLAGLQTVAQASPCFVGADRPVQEAGQIVGEADQTGDLVGGAGGPAR
jgi:hypothetical protein